MALITSDCGNRYCSDKPAPDGHGCPLRKWLRKCTANQRTLLMAPARLPDPPPPPGSAGSKKKKKKDPVEQDPLDVRWTHREAREAVRLFYDNLASLQVSHALRLQPTWRIAAAAVG